MLIDHINACKRGALIAATELILLDAANTTERS